VRIGHWQAPAGWRRIDLLSDVHLHAQARRTFDAWRAHLLGTPADAVLILGDLFEVWVGDDSRAGGFAKECADILREAASRKAVAFMHGNRDFLLGPAMLGDCGLQPLPDPTLAQAWDQRVLLTHGDALCLADVDYQRFRTEVRGQAWRRGFLALSLDERERQARAMRDASQAHQARRAAEHWFDVDAAEATRWLDQAAAPTLVHGHTHHPAVHDLGDGRVRHVLGDWDFETRPARARLLCWTAQGLTPLDLGQP